MIIGVKKVFQSMIREQRTGNACCALGQRPVARMPGARMPHGFLNVLKPAGISSHHCVVKVRKLLKTRQVGHAGTLDPMATGVLTMALGNATKFLQVRACSPPACLLVRCAADWRRECCCCYCCCSTWPPARSTPASFASASRPTRTTSPGERSSRLVEVCAASQRFSRACDSDRKVLSERPAPWLTQEEVNAALQRFVGSIDQVPPRVSAIRKNGVRMYDLARVNPVRRSVICFPAIRIRCSSYAADLQRSGAGAGDRRRGPARPHREDRLARLCPRPVSSGTSPHSCTPGWFLHPQQLTDCRQRIPQASIHVECGSGTYIRSIARECGEALVIPSRHADSTCQLKNTKGELCVGGTLAALERTRNGAFTLSDSVGLEDLEQLVQVSPHRSSRCCRAARSILTRRTAATQTQQSPLQSIESALLHLPFVVLPSKSAHRWEIGGIVCISLNDAVTEEHAAVALQDGSPVRVYEGPAGRRRFRGVSRVETQPEGDHFILRKRTFV